MNQRAVGIIVIISGLLLATFVYMAKDREDRYIQDIIDQTGSCYLKDGTCLHDDRDYSLYIGGWVLAAALIILGIYLLIFDKIQRTLLEHQARMAGDLKEAKQKDEFKAFLTGFSEDEQHVLRAVHEQEGIKQSTLRYKAGLSKTGLSLMLKNFEEKGIISRKESGKTNEVYLRKKF